MSHSSPDPTDDLTLALAAALRSALEDLPDIESDTGRLAASLAPALSIRLADAAVAAGASPSVLARALAARPGPSFVGADSLEARVLAALKRHPAGRSPGVAPDSLATLAAVSSAALGRAVSTLVQAGELVRDGWLVRLPQPDDLLPSSRLPARHDAGDHREEERRAIGDRRAVGERRLYDRRGLP